MLAALTTDVRDRRDLPQPVAEPAGEVFDELPARADAGHEDLVLVDAVLVLHQRHDVREERDVLLEHGRLLPAGADGLHVHGDRRQHGEPLALAVFGPQAPLPKP
jgi:hypothetical protein